jgi:hypothetical protein
MMGRRRVQSRRSNRKKDKIGSSVLSHSLPTRSMEKTVNQKRKYQRIKKPITLPYGFRCDLVRYDGEFFPYIYVSSKKDKK